MEEAKHYFDVLLGEGHKDAKTDPIKAEDIERMFKETAEAQLKKGAS